MGTKIRFSLFSILAVFGLTNADFCTETQFQELSVAIAAEESINPADFQIVGDYVSAKKAAVETALGGSETAAGYPCPSRYPLA